MTLSQSFVIFVHWMSKTTAVITSVVFAMAGTLTFARSTTMLGGRCLIEDHNLAENGGGSSEGQ